MWDYIKPNHWYFSKGESSKLKTTVADELEIQNSCSLILNGTQFIVGGGTDKNQGIDFDSIID